MSAKIDMKFQELFTSCFFCIFGLSASCPKNMTHTHTHNSCRSVCATKTTCVDTHLAAGIGTCQLYQHDFDIQGQPYGFSLKVAMDSVDLTANSGDLQ